MTWAVIVMLASTAFDVGTTAHAIKRGCVEANPVLVATHMNTPLRITIFEGGASVGFVWLLGKSEKKHPKATKAVALSIAGSHALAGVWNLNQACNGPSRPSN